MACEQLVAALKGTRMYGISHNLRYLQSLVASASFQNNHVHTKWLADFHPAESALFVIDGGLHTTLQDWPGRLGHWDVGVPPSGPMDELSFRIGNLLLGNDEGACGLEFTMRGGVYQFRDDTWFCLTGADMSAELDGQLVDRYRPLLARAGQVLRLSDAKACVPTCLWAEDSMFRKLLAADRHLPSAVLEVTAEGHYCLAMSSQ
ncbi:hypothetical protein GCM10025858_31790 [Alicyclobacillus sacchari]|nr:hypothetical protein GCM10025858_31790 [Alicyclobacillus sacchari]